MFRLLNSSGTGVINLHEFYQIYDALDMHWRVKKEQPFWFSHVRSKPLAFVVNQVHRFVTWNIFDYFVCEFNLEIFCFLPFSLYLTFLNFLAFVIFLGGILMLTRTASLSEHMSNPLELGVTWETYAFVSCNIIGYKLNKS